MNGQTVILSSPTSRNHAKRIIDSAPNGFVMNVREMKRTNDQNALMWAKLSDVSRSKPEGRTLTPDLWKALFMQACGHEVQFLNGLDGMPFPVGFRSSKLSKAQMGELIDFIDAYGAQHGVVWSNEKEGNQ